MPIDLENTPEEIWEDIELFELCQLFECLPSEMLKQDYELMKRFSWLKQDLEERRAIERESEEPKGNG